MSGRIGYRRLVKAASVAFKNDSRALNLAKQQLKQEFLANRHVTDRAELDLLFKGVDEAEEMLTFHIVQGAKNSKGNYGVVTI